ncbi:FecR family protein [Mangrovibacterium marinum]|uniref:FecR family protein n=1 Tax=Mangrovibacterium marinum TaxID=1639118 RepID=A0A2T5BZV0_9BACT|nr:FecR domain-containing protein [Mangrovibacterium marinum]PTN07818.1 FecR family protein [Mangrovibacterium marinum]
MKITPNDIKRYLEGKAAPSESEQVKQWLANPQNEAVARAVLGDLWTNSEIKLRSAKPDFEQMLWKTKFRMRPEEQSVGSLRASSRRARLGRAFSKAAAILIFPIIAFTAYLYFTYPVQQAATSAIDVSQYREVYTKPGTKLHFQLADGTMVWLNDGTTLRYPEVFAGPKREVFVDGEAYFEVKADKQHPFIVNNPMMNTLVTGTHFNINAYAADKFFEATLLEGHIALEGKSGNVELTPGEQLQLNMEAKTMVQKKVKSKNAIGWIDGRLIIQNERLDAALKKISRWYNVEIVVADKNLNNYELTCTLENEKMDQCMSLIANVLPVRYHIELIDEHKRIILTKQ